MAAHDLQSLASYRLSNNSKGTTASTSKPIAVYLRASCRSHRANDRRHQPPATYEAKNCRPNVSQSCFLNELVDRGIGALELEAWKRQVAGVKRDYRYDDFLRLAGRQLDISLQVERVRITNKTMTCKTNLCKAVEHHRFRALDRIFKLKLLHAQIAQLVFDERRLSNVERRARDAGLNKQRHVFDRVDAELQLCAYYLPTQRSTNEQAHCNRL